MQTGIKNKFIDVLKLNGLSSLANLKKIKQLLAKGLNANDLIFLNRTLLHFACRDGYFSIVQYLIEQGADVNVKDREGTYPIYLACRFGHLIIVKYLIEECKAEISYNEALNWSIGSNSLELIQYLVEHGADIHVRDNDGNTPLHKACNHGYLEIAQYFIKHGADVNAETNSGFTPLHYACLNNNLELVKYLIEECKAEIEKDIKFRTPLDIAREMKLSLPVIEYLEDYITDQNLIRYASLRNLVAQAEHLDDRYYYVKQVLAKGRDVNRQDQSGNTALHDACAMSADLEMIQFLIEECKAEVNIKNKDGYTPFHILCAQLHPQDAQIIYKLVETYNADICAKNYRGETPAMCLKAYIEHVSLNLNKVYDKADLQKMDVQVTFPYMYVDENNQVKYKYPYELHAALQYLQDLENAKKCT